jgi:hypothetical protein
LASGARLDRWSRLLVVEEFPRNKLSCACRSASAFEIGALAVPCWSGRLVLEAEGWRVTIDTLERLQALLKSLTLQRGYAVTHVGKLEHSDQENFTLEEADEFLIALYLFLSFSSGLRTLPILPVGYDISGEKVWEKWTFDYIAAPWRSVYSWFPAPDGHSLSKAFPGFLRRWKSETWHEPIKLAIHWYIESQAGAGGIQASIFLIQTALELLSWVFLVGEGGISEKDFRDKNNKNYNSTSKKINRLFENLDIPQEIPPSFTNLIKFENTLRNSYKNISSLSTLSYVISPIKVQPRMNQTMS